MNRQLLAGLPVIVALLSPLWMELPSWAAEVDNPPAEAPIKRARPSAEVMAVVVKGRALRNAGDLDGGRAAFEDALAKARAAKDVAGESLALNNVASIYRYQAGLTSIAPNQSPPADLIGKSADLYAQAVKAARAVGDKFDEGYATLYLGVLAAGKGNADQAFKHYDDALTIFKALDDRYYTARTFMFMGSTTLYHRKQAEASLKHFEQALPLFRDAKYWNEAQWVVRDMDVAYEQLMAQAKGQR